MAFEDHLFQTASGGSPSYSAREFRAMFSELWDEGVLEGLKVAQRGAGANMSVDINIGGAIVTGDDQTRQGNYIIRCTALENKTVTAAPGSNSRLDLVVAEVLDPDSGGAAGRITQFRVIAGTAAGSPVLPALPPTAIPLAQLGPILTSTSSITTGLITDLRTWAGPRGLPGEVMAIAGGNTAVPNGWLFAAGQAVSRTTYARLFDRIGTLYGVGDGSTTFNLPDLRGRVAVGFDNMNGTAASRISGLTTPGQSGGAATHTLTTAELAAHTHGAGSYATDPAAIGGGAMSASGLPVASGFGFAMSSTVSASFYPDAGTIATIDIPSTAVTGTSGSTGSGTAVDMTQPYAGFIYVIRT